MKISEIRAGMRRIDIQGQIVDIENPRDVQTKFGPGQVTAATLKDTSGQVQVTLWNENIGKVAVGSYVEIENAYADSFRGNLQVQVGRYGKLSVLQAEKKL